MKKNQFYRDMLDACSMIYEREINNTKQSKYYLNKHLSDLMSQMEHLFEIPLLQSDFEVWSKSNKQVADLYVKVSDARDFSDDWYGSDVTPDFDAYCVTCDFNDDGNGCAMPVSDRDYACSKAPINNMVTLEVDHEDLSILFDALASYNQFYDICCSIDPTNDAFEHYYIASCKLLKRLSEVSKPLN